MPEADRQARIGCLSREAPFRLKNQQFRNQYLRLRPMNERVSGAAVFTVSELDAPEYAPNRGVFLAGILGKARGDGFGLYRGTINPGCEIAREIHPEASETVYILAGQAVATVEDQEVALGPGRVIHIDKNVHHGLRNIGEEILDFIVIGHPDF